MSKHLRRGGWNELIAAYIGSTCNAESFPHPHFALKWIRMGAQFKRRHCIHGQFGDIGFQLQQIR